MTANKELTTAKKKLKQIWKTILNIQEVSNGTNFFDAGGTSRLLMELQNKINEEFGFQPSLVELMTYSNINSFADFISSRIN